MMFRKFIICILFMSAGVQAKDSVNIEFGLEFPTYFGMHTKISSHSNLYTRLGFGFVNDVMIGVPGVSQFMGYLSPDYESEHIQFAFDVINNSLYGSVSVGWRMQEREGAYAELGYSIIHKVGGSELVKDKDNESILGQLNLTSERLLEGTRVNATLHNGTLHVGYMLPLSARVNLSTELGLIKPLYSRVAVQYGADDNKEQAKESSEEIKKIMNQLWMVTGSLWLSFIF